MQAHILSLHTPSAPGVGSKDKNTFFLKVVMMHIKLKGMERSASCKHINCPYTHPKPLGVGSKGQTLWSCCIIKGKEV